MSDDPTTLPPEDASRHRVSEPRRRVLQALAAAAAGVTMLPSAWTKPVVGTIVVPAHAAVSPASPTPTMSMSPSPSISLGVTPTMTPTLTVTPTDRPNDDGWGQRGPGHVGPLGLRR